MAEGALDKTEHLVDNKVHGLRINRQDDQSFTILHYVVLCRRYTENVVDCLINAGADVNIISAHTIRASYFKQDAESPYIADELHETPGRINGTQ